MSVIGKKLRKHNGKIWSIIDIALSLRYVCGPTTQKQPVSIKKSRGKKQVEGKASEHIMQSEPT